MKIEKCTDYYVPFNEVIDGNLKTNVIWKLPYTAESKPLFVTVEASCRII